MPAVAQVPCEVPTAWAELDINNVRCGIGSANRLWLGDTDGLYQVPNDEFSGPSALFAGAVWIGGLNGDGQLKLAANTHVPYAGFDFLPGPLDENGEVNQATCTDFDRIWEVTGQDIDVFLSNANQSNDVCPSLNTSQVPLALLNWPGRNNPHFNDFDLPQDQDLAPFWDCNADGIYDPTKGDYPVLDHEVEGVYADQMFWTISNDLGQKLENESAPMGIELSTLAFAFTSDDDDLNNATFYRHRFSNVSADSYSQTYLAHWADVDLGEFQDDFVGCDSSRNLAIGYNGDIVDGPSDTAYEGIPPMIGIDLLRTPLDENGEELGMTSFVYHNNDFTVIGNSETIQHFYNYMQGIWKDGSPITFGGTGYGGTIPNPYMFPSDPSLTGTAEDGIWSECSAENIPADRRLIQGCGPFDFLTGQIVTLDVGVIFAESVGGCGSGASFSEIQAASDNAQVLADDNFFIDETTGIHDLAEVAFDYRLEGRQIVLSDLPGKALVQLVSIDGQLQKQIHTAEDHSDLFIDYSNFPAGIYLLRVADTKSGSSATTRILL